MPRPSSLTTSTRLLCALTAAGLLAACGPTSSESGERQQLPEQSESAKQAAETAARDAAGGEEVGGSVEILGVLSGPQLDAYLGTFEPFEKATGIDVRYEGSRDLNAVLQTRLEGGNPPDVVSNPSAGQMRQLATDGDLIAIDEIIDPQALEENFPAGLVDLTRVDGQTYGLFFNSAVNNLVWYDPKRYEGPLPADTIDELTTWASQEAQDGRPPFCIGIESGPASGWPGAGWIEQLVLTQAGPETFDRWVAGDLSWTSPEIKEAFEAFGSVVADGMAAGGPTAVLTTSFDVSPQGLVSKDPACSLHVQADFLGNLLASAVPGVKPVEDLDFFPFPAGDNGEDPGLITSGEMIGAFKDTPQVDALMRYIATPEFGTLVAGTGQWIASNQKTTKDAYTTPLSRQAADLYASAPIVRYTAQNTFGLELSQAFLQAVVAYVEDPESLDSQLAHLDEVARSQA